MDPLRRELVPRVIGSSVSVVTLAAIEDPLSRLVATAPGQALTCGVPPRLLVLALQQPRCARFFGWNDSGRLGPFRDTGHSGFP